MEDILFVIPAREESKGLPGKNIRLLCGKPLISYSVEVARQLVPDHQICVSTDSREVIKVVNKIGLEVPFIRPKELATDTAPTIGVLKHANNFYKEQGHIFRKLVLLQVTSPLRRAIHVKEAVALLDESVDMVVSVTQSNANPYYVLYEERKGLLCKSKELPHAFERRQDAPVVYQLNGSIYVYNIQSLVGADSFASLERKRKYVMEKEYSVDIDDIIDFEFCELLLKKGYVTVD